MFMLSTVIKVTDYQIKVLPIMRQHLELLAKTVFYFSLLASFHVLLSNVLLYLDCGVSFPFFDGVTPIYLFGVGGSKGTGKNEVAPAPVQDNVPAVPNTAAVRHNLPVAPNNVPDHVVQRNFRANLFEYLGQFVGEETRFTRFNLDGSVFNGSQQEFDPVLIAAANKVESPRNAGAVGQSFSNSNGPLSPPNRWNSQQLFSPSHDGLLPRPMSPPNERNSQPLYSPRNLNNAGEAGNAAPAINNNNAPLAKLAANVHNNNAAMAELAANVHNNNAAMRELAADVHNNMAAMAELAANNNAHMAQLAANGNAIAGVANNINAALRARHVGELRLRLGVRRPLWLNQNNAGGAGNAAPAGNRNNAPNDGNAYPVDDDHAWPVEDTDLWDLLPAYRGVANVAPAGDRSNAGGAGNAAPAENVVNVRGYRFVELQLKGSRCLKGPGKPGEPFDPGTNSMLQQVLPKKELPLRGNGLSHVEQGDEVIAEYSLLGYCVLCVLSFIGGLWFIMYSAVALTPSYNIIKAFLNKKMKK
jgi:hypothetical protein